MCKVDTDLDLEGCFLFTLKQGLVEKFSDATYGRFTMAVGEQDQIGWSNFMEGKIAQMWHQH